MTSLVELEPRLAQALFETTLDLILITDSQGNLLEVSPSAYSILGYMPTEMIGHSAIDFLYPQDLESTREEMRRARKTGAMRHFLCRYRSKTGKVIMLTWTGVWVPALDKHFFIGRDITQSLGSVREMDSQLVTIEKRLRRMSSSTARWHFSDAYMMEVYLILSSMWAAYVLSSGPSNFIMFPSSFAAPRYLMDNEGAWAAFAGIAAMFKLWGFIGQFIFGQKSFFPFIANCLGFAMSGIFWLVMGGSSLYGNPDTLLGFSGALMGVFATWSLLRLVW